MTGNTLLRTALDAHDWAEEFDTCMCGWQPDHPPDSRDDGDWRDHREAAVRAALGDDHADLRQAVIEAAERIRESLRFANTPTQAQLRAMVEAVDALHAASEAGK